MYKRQDHFFKKAKNAGLAARSYFKLEEIDKKHHLLKEGYHVLDLGAAPGSWMQYVSKRLKQKGKIVGIDISPLEIIIEPNMVFFQENIYTIDETKLKNISEKYDVVMSDMAPKTTGIRLRDQSLSLELCQRSFNFCKKFLKTNGAFLCKIFQGPDSDHFIKELRTYFKTVKIVKPESSRKESYEVYVLGLEYNLTSSIIISRKWQ